MNAEFYKTTISFDVYSDEEIDENLSLTKIERQIEHGRWTATAYSHKGIGVAPMEMADLLEAQCADVHLLLGKRCRRNQPHIEFEYDTDYTGGNYSELGEFAYIPLGLYEDYEDYYKAFKWWTGIDPIHIIKIDTSNWYTHEGEDYKSIFPPLEPEGFELDPDDEVELDASKIERWL